MMIYGREVNIWDGQFRKQCDRKYKISLCTTCMGRLDDLRQTLKKNIFDNCDYGPVEFVILDYNSKDGLENWVKSNLAEDIQQGRLIYARTTDPRWYHMAHSRNVAFKIASGDIVCNVDADNWTGPGFATKLNQLANECPERAIFAKGRRLLRGRLGFFKKEWDELLGGYDESLSHYGHDDWDLVNRAWLQGFRLMWFGGQYVTRLSTGGAKKVENMEQKDWRATEAKNREISANNIALGMLKSNQGKRWGAATVIKNFSETLLV